MCSNRVNSQATYCTFIYIHHPWAITDIRTYSWARACASLDENHSYKDYYYSSIPAVGEKYKLQLAKLDQVYWYNSHKHLTKRKNTIDTMWWKFFSIVIEMSIWRCHAQLNLEATKWVIVLLRAGYSIWEIHGRLEDEGVMFTLCKNSLLMS